MSASTQERAAVAALAALGVLAMMVASPGTLQSFLSSDGQLDAFTVDRIQYLRFGVIPFSLAVLWALVLRRAPTVESLKIVSTVTATALLVVLAITAAMNLRMPAFVLAHTETAYYLASLRWASGLFPYNDPQAMPIASLVYTPLFTAICAFLFRLFGPAVVFPKLVALTASAALLVLQCLAMKRARFSGFGMSYGLMTTLAIASPWYLVWARADSLCALFSLAAILALSSAGTLSAAGAALLAVLAVMSKQTGIFLYPVGLYLLWSRRAKLGEWAAFGMIVPAAGLLSTKLLDRVSEGFYSFWVNKLIGALPLKSLPSLIYDQVPMLMWMALFPALALVLLAGASSKKILPAARSGLQAPLVKRVGAAFVLGLPILILLSSRVGGGDNSYLPLLALLGIIAGAWFDAWATGGGAASKTLRWGAAAVFSLAAALFAVFPPLHLHLALLRKASDVPAMVEELRDWAQNGPSEFAAVVRGGRSEGASYQESVNLAATLAHLGQPLDEEVSLMDYTAAGYPVPARVRETLISGRVQKIIAPKGFEPFGLLNHMYWGPIPMEPEKRFLYPADVRAAFRACYGLAKINMNYFDLFVYQGCRWPK